MAQDNPFFESTSTKRLLQDRVRLIEGKDCGYEIARIEDTLSFEKGLFAVIRASQLLAEKNNGIILIGLAGPSGAGKTTFAEKILNVMPSVAILSMDNYSKSGTSMFSKLDIFEDPRLTDYDMLLKDIRDLKDGKAIEVPIYDFKKQGRMCYRALKVPSSRIVIVEGVYALSEVLRPFLDLRVSLTGGTHIDLFERVLRDILQDGQEPEDIRCKIYKEIYPMYKEFIEPDLQTAHIRIVNKCNTFTGFLNPTYILKSSKKVSLQRVMSAMSEDYTEAKGHIYNFFLMPPSEDPETCQSYLWMRYSEGKYYLVFEESVTDPPFIISPRINFKVSVRIVGLLKLGYQVSFNMNTSHVFQDDRVSVKFDSSEQLGHPNVQVFGRDWSLVKSVAEKLGLKGSYISHTYLEQLKLENLLNEVLPQDLETKLNRDDEMLHAAIRTISGMSHSYSTGRDKKLTSITGLSINSQRFDGRNPDANASLASQGQISELPEQISTVKDRMDELKSRIRELCDKMGEGSHQERQVKKSKGVQIDAIVVSLILAFACGGVGILKFKGRN